MSPSSVNVKLVSAPVLVQSCILGFPFSVPIDKKYSFIPLKSLKPVQFALALALSLNQSPSLSNPSATVPTVGGMRSIVMLSEPEEDSLPTESIQKIVP